MAATVLAPSVARAQAPAKYHRLNLQNPKAPLDSYRRAVTAMLKLPPSDARNWYRHSFIHTIDCPHGNWWFLPWHRAYTGWFERICRELSGDANFALPFWDWTETPKIPAVFFEGVLTPENDLFLSSFEAFEKEFRNPTSDLWKSFNRAQLNQLAQRPNYVGNGTFQTVEGFWQAVPSMFFPKGQTRTLTPAAPGFDAGTRRAVSLRTLQTALAATDFVSFGSGVVSQHSESTDQGILESQPHNLVHNNVGGFMSDLLSPVDPIFFMHHSNIERLWDVWTQKQNSIHKPTLPEGQELKDWKKEPFLFYVDEKGKPVAKNKAGDYSSIGDFDYDYEPASASDVAPKPSPFTQKVWGAQMLAKSSAIRNVAKAEVALPDALPKATMQQDGTKLFALVTLKPGVDTRDVQFHVLVNPPQGTTQVNFDDPSFAGTFSVFGRQAAAGHADKPQSFTVALTDAVAKLVDAKRVDPSSKLQVQVVAERKGAPLDLNVAEVSVGAF